MTPSGPSSLQNRNRFGWSTTYSFFIGSAVLAAALVCGIAARLHAVQQSNLRQMSASAMSIRQARLDVSKAILYLTPAGQPAAPANREMGLALLQQSAASLGAAAAGDPSSPVQITLDDFQTAVSAYRAANPPPPGVEADLRAAYQGLESQLEAADGQRQQQLQQMQAQSDTLSGFSVAGAAILFLGLCAALVYTARAKAAAGAAPGEREGLRNDAPELHGVENKRDALAERLALATRSAHMGIWDWDIQKNELVWDDRMYALYGLQPGEFGAAYEAWLQGVHPADRESSNNASAAAVRGEREYDTEFRVLWPDGSVHWIKANGEVFYDQHGAPLRMVGVNMDITGRKQAEAALQESEARYRLLAENISDVIWVLDLQSSKYTYVSPSVTGLRGYSVEEVLAQEMASSITPASAQYLAQILPPRLAEFHRGTENTYIDEIEQTRKDGSTVWTETSSHFVVNPANHRLEVYGVSRDITARKLAQEQMQKMTNLIVNGQRIAHLGSFEYDAVTKHTVWSEEEFRIYGYDPAQASPDYATMLAKSIHPEDAALLDQTFQTAMQNGAVYELEHRIVRPDGSVRWVFDRAYPYQDQAGQLSRYIGVTLDTTERRQMEEDLRRSNAELEQFAYVASHDLQEPLRTVAGMVQLLQKRYQGQLDARADEYIHYAVDASDRMQHLISDLLEFSRIDRKGQPFERIEGEQVLKIALDNLQAVITESRAVITHDPLPAVTADAGQMVQVFQNLIGNAIKFRSERPPEIHIGVQKAENGWQFSVQDNGIGIESQYFERIFVLFQRLHTRNKYPGTGIGLALCQKIVERHGGKIWVKSTFHQGATFYFTIQER